jgi:hypothetical protein
MHPCFFEALCTRVVFDSYTSQIPLIFLLLLLLLLCRGHVMSFKLSPNLRKPPSVQLSEARATEAAALSFGDAMESDEEGDPSALAEQAQKLQKQMAEAQREGLQRVLQIAGACKTAEAAYDACWAAPSND